MNSEVPKWLLPGPAVCFASRSELPGPAVCFASRSEEASQNETKEEEEEEERERCKRPRTMLDMLDCEGGVEEFLVLLERIEETKKYLKKKRTNFSVGSISARGGINAAEDQILTAMPAMAQAQGSSDAIDMIAYNKRGMSPWKPSFQWEDFNISKSVSAQIDIDLNGAAATEKNTDEEGSIGKGNDSLRARSFLDGVTSAECSHDRADDVNNKKEEDLDGATKLELQLFPI